jgi:hypothetical protein
MKGNDMAEIEDVRLDAERHARLAPITTPEPDIEGDMLRKLVAWRGVDGSRSANIIIDGDVYVGLVKFAPDGMCGLEHRLDAPTLPALAAKLDEWLAGQLPTDCGRLGERP